nr:hypothetical protein [Tanacetum cinerariifolium]
MVETKVVVAWSAGCGGGEGGEEVMRWWRDGDHKGGEMKVAAWLGIVDGLDETERRYQGWCLGEVVS